MKIKLLVVARGPPRASDAMGLAGSASYSFLFFCGSTRFKPSHHCLVQDSRRSQSLLDRIGRESQAGDHGGQDLGLKEESC